MKQAQPVTAAADTRPRAPMRIGLNLLHALPEIGGGWNYIQRLVSALNDYDNCNQYVAFVTRHSECLVRERPNFKKVLVNIESQSRPRRVLYENTVLQLTARRHSLDCMHWFANTQAVINAAPAVVTVYDLQAFFNYSSASFHKSLYLQTMMRLTAHRAEMLLPMSEATASDLLRILRVPPERLIVIPPIVDDWFRPRQRDEVTEFKERLRLPQQFWLYVAHLYPHKNHLGLLRAYRVLKQQGLQPWPLVLRGDPKGAESEVMQAISDYDLQSDIIFLPRLEEFELPLLYSAATAVVFPSFYEGGGIPVIEAMACGCPLLASNIPPVREFAGDVACYFEPRSDTSIAEAIHAFQACDHNAQGSRQASLARADTYKAPLVVRRLVDAYQRLSRVH